MSAGFLRRGCVVKCHMKISAISRGYDVSARIPRPPFWLPACSSERESEVFFMKTLITQIKMRTFIAILALASLANLGSAPSAQAGFHVNVSLGGGGHGTPQDEG